MSVKCKYADIKEIYDWYNRYADEKMAKLYDTQPSTYDIAYYIPSGANWAYKIGLVNVDGQVYKVVTVFGAVKAVMPTNTPEYTLDELKARSF